jgi:uncharacterized protein YbjQ (UPF0145 family)
MSIENISSIPTNEVIWWAEMFFPWQAWQDPDNWSFELVVKSVWSTILYALIGWGVAAKLEKRHMRQLIAREHEVEHIKLISGSLNGHIGQSDLLIGSASFCHDFFRSFFIFFRKLVGGQISHYQRLIERARREAICRLKEEALVRGVDCIYQVRIEENNLSSHLARVEVVAYGTAVKD